MSTLKKWGLWIILIIAFWIFSDFVTKVGLNASYKNMTNVGNTPSNIEVYQAQSTGVSGRIKGDIKNSSQNNISNKYLQVQLFGEDGNVMSEQYIPIGEVAEDGNYPFEVYYQAKGTKGYLLNIVDKMVEGSLIPRFELLDMDLTGKSVLAIWFMLTLAGFV